MKIEFINLNEDPRLDPEIKEIPLSKDAKNRPPSYCLPWVEATRYSIQIKSNEEYVIQKKKNSIVAWVKRGGKKIPMTDIWLKVPEGISFVPKNATEAMEKKIQISRSPFISSPWQLKYRHSITLKLGIYWWTPPGWGLFFTSAIHRNENFRVVEGFVRTDIWHRDIPIVIQPLLKEVRVPKFSIVASAFLVPAQELHLANVTGDKGKIQEVIKQVSRKRLDTHIYKNLILPKDRRDH